MTILARITRIAQLAQELPASDMYIVEQILNECEALLNAYVQIGIIRRQTRRAMRKLNRMYLELTTAMKQLTDSQDDQ